MDRLDKLRAITRRLDALCQILCPVTLVVVAALILYEYKIGRGIDWLQVGLGITVAVAYATISWLRKRVL
jgi:hypothetical protein